MTTIIVKFAVDLLLIIALAFLAWFIKHQVKKLISKFIDALVHLLEKFVVGSKLGAERKKILIASLESSGIKVNTFMVRAIDKLVEIMNAKKAVIEEQATANASDVVDAAVSAVDEAIK